MNSDFLVGSESSRLIIIRGNSGSGKSTLAAALRAARPTGTLAVVGQDIIRRTVLGTGDDVGTTAIGLVDLTTRYALQNGFDVIVEGIYHAARYGQMLTALREDHVDRTRAYLYDLPFEETLRRHATKDALRFGEEEMRSWWHGFQPVDGLHEQRITQNDSLETTVARILTDCWGQAQPVSAASARYPYRGDT